MDQKKFHKIDVKRTLAVRLPGHPPAGASSGRAGPAGRCPSFQKPSWSLFLHSRKSGCSWGHKQPSQSRGERHTCLMPSASENCSDITPQDCYFFFFFSPDWDNHLPCSLTYLHVSGGLHLEQLFFQNLNCFALVVPFASNHVNTEQTKS